MRYLDNSTNFIIKVIFNSAFSSPWIHNGLILDLSKSKFENQKIFACELWFYQDYSNSIKDNKSNKC
jgi:hypothetical protein